VARPHPPLKDHWLDIAVTLAQYGNLDRSALRFLVCLSNKEMKTHSKLMKMRGLIEIKNGLFWLTDFGHERLAQTREAML
jgi:hypothetical protein